MKTKIFISSVLVFSVMAFIFSKPSAETNSSYNPPPPTNLNDSFLVGVLSVGDETNYNTYAPLNINLWHEYPNWWLGDVENGWINHVSTDKLNEPFSNYGQQIITLLNNNQTNGMRTLMDRVKIEYLAYGARSDYQAEDSSFLAPQLQDHWFYTYRNAGTVGVNEIDNSSYGNGVRVKHCRTAPTSTDPPGYVVKGLKTNREQIDMNSVYWIDDKIHKWFVKPRIRIDSNFARNNPNTNICRIEIVKWNGDTLKTITLRGRNFLDGSGNYNGHYKEEYKYFFDDPDTLAFGPGNEMNPSNPPKSSLDENCKVDFRVYWYGNCDMWLDYVRVDSDAADQLLNPNNPLYTSRQEWLQWEVQQIAMQSASPVQFYIEEWEFNQLPCMAYVSHKIDSLSGGKFSLMCFLNYTRMFYHIPDWQSFNYESGVDYIIRNLVNKVGLKQIFGGSYPFQGHTGVYIPNTLPKCSEFPGACQYNPSTGMLANSTTPGLYETWMQDMFDDLNSRTSFRYEMYRADTISKQLDIPFIDIFQTHLWKTGGYTQREPTNEEMDLMSNLAVSYGAKGLLSFWYDSFGCINSGDNYGRGLTDPEPCGAPQGASGLIPRHDNVYGQWQNGAGSSKFLTVGSMNQRLRKWGPALMSFDNANRHSYIYRIEREALLSESYFTEIYSLKISNSPPACEEDFPEDIPFNWVAECKPEKYLQVATFKTISAESNRYFMIVNRRCSPYKNGLSEDDNGGRRWVKVRFDKNHPEMSASNKWKIIDLETNTTVGPEFDKTEFPLIDLGIFMPGTGKLYKLVPVS